MNSAMKKHALGVLQVYVRNHERRGPFKAHQCMTSRLISSAIIESEALGGTMLSHFWERLSACHPKFNENVPELQNTKHRSDEASSKVLLQGVPDCYEINLKPVYDMAAETFIHLGLALMNPGGRDSVNGYPPEYPSDKPALRLRRLPGLNWGKKTIDRLFKVALVRNKELQHLALQTLALRRDGIESPLTRLSFGEECAPGIGLREITNPPILTQIIPDTICTNDTSLQYISMFSGVPVTSLLKYLNTVDNLLLTQFYPQLEFACFKYAIEAQVASNGQVKYIHRGRRPLLLDDDGDGDDDEYDIYPEEVAVLPNDGDELSFGRGTEGVRLGPGPLPVLCNIRLAVQRFLMNSKYSIRALNILHKNAEKYSLDGFPAELITPHFRDLLSGALGDAYGPQVITYEAILHEALQR